MDHTLTTVNFKKEPYKRLTDFAHKDDKFMIVKTETIPWKITLRLMARTIPPEENNLPEHRVLMDDADTDKYVDIDIECLYEHRSTDQWHMVAEFEILLEMRNEKITKKMERRFDSSSKSFNSGPLAIPELFANSISEISEDFTFNLKIQIKEDVGIILSEFSIPRNIDSEIVVRLDDHILFVDKYALMAFSPEMHEQISDNELRIAQMMFKYDDFVTFLRILYGQKQEYTVNNVYGLAKLAVVYDIEFYISECEDYIIRSKELPISYKLYLSASCELPKVQAVIVENITMDEIKEAFEEPVHIFPLTEQILAMKLGDNAETIINELKSTEKWKKLIAFVDSMSMPRLEEALKISNKAEDVLDYMRRTKHEED